MKLLRQAAAFHFKGGELEKSTECLEQVLQSDPSDVATMARLVLLYSQVSNPSSVLNNQSFDAHQILNSVGANEISKN